MEVIKKQIMQIVTTASTTCDIDVEGPCFEFIPDTTKNYNLKILLKTKDIDFGFFDVLDIDGQYNTSGGDNNGFGLGVDNLL